VEPLVSVVTPFYNTREYLRECIESVLGQTYGNWEYILVDNQSTDGSSEIAGQYAARFPGKIRLVRTDSFLSQVRNYNFALSLISPGSTYCKMVQADDWIFPECLRSMVEVAEAHPQVGIVSAYELESDHPSLGGLPYPSPEVSGREACRLYFHRNIHLFGTPTSLLMRSELVRSRTPFYEERLAPFEDFHVCFEVLFTWKLGFVHQVLTYSRRDNESMLARIRPYQFELFTRLAVTVLHGRNYLSQDEYQYLLNQAERRYFLFLAASAIEGKDAKFWEFHRQHLATINYDLNSAFMAKWVALVLLDYAGNPKRTFEYFWPRRKRIFELGSRVFSNMHRLFVRKRLTEKL
jgi:glycosyltransferase involved in cell wall biosynthesis